VGSGGVRDIGDHECVGGGGIDDVSYQSCNCYYHGGVRRLYAKLTSVASREIRVAN
jgi:hypothetical protein